MTGQPDFFTETAVTPERKVEKWFPSKLNIVWQCFLIYSFFVPWPIDPVIIGLMMMMKTEYFKEFDIGLVRLNSALRLSDYVQVDKKF